MKPNDYTSLQGWMYDMGLNLSELITYAVIYGFSWDGHSCYRGTVEQVGEFSQVKPRQARYILANLEQRGLITRKEVPGKITEYAVVLPVPRSAVVNPGTEVPPALECLPPGTGMPPTPALECRPNNNINNNLEIIDTQSSPRAREDMLPFGEYVRMTEKEHAQLVQRFGATDAARICEILDAYLAKKPGAYKSHYRAALGWPVTRLQEEKLTQQRLANAQGRPTEQRRPTPTDRPVYAGQAFWDHLKEIENRQK